MEHKVSLGLIKVAALFWDLNQVVNGLDSELVNLLPLLLIISQTMDSWASLWSAVTWLKIPRDMPKARSEGQAVFLKSGAVIGGVSQALRRR